MEGDVAHSGGDQVDASLEGDVVDIGTRPSWGCQSLQKTTRVYVV